MLDKSSVASIDRNLVLEAVRVAEAAALAASREMGRGDERAADRAAMEAMRAALNTLTIDGTIVIGREEPDESDMLCTGEKVDANRGGSPIDIALDPLEGVAICSKGGQNALACVSGQKMQGRLLLRNDDERARAHRRSITDFIRKYVLCEMVRRDISSPPPGPPMALCWQGRHRFKGGATTHTIAISAKSGTLKTIKARHRLKPVDDIFGK